MKGLDWGILLLAGVAGYAAYELLIKPAMAVEGAIGGAIQGASDLLLTPGIQQIGELLAQPGNEWITTPGWQLIANAIQLPQTQQTTPAKYAYPSGKIPITPGGTDTYVTSTGKIQPLSAAKIAPSAGTQQGKMYVATMPTTEKTITSAKITVALGKAPTAYTKMIYVPTTAAKTSGGSLRPVAYDPYLKKIVTVYKGKGR